MINPERYVAYVSLAPGAARADGVVFAAVGLVVDVVDLSCGKVIERSGGPAHMSFADFRSAIEAHDLECDLARMLAEDGGSDGGGAVETGG